MKSPNCFMPACGIEGKLCPDCAAFTAPDASAIDPNSAEYQDGSAEGKAQHARGHYREAAPGESPNWRAGYEAAWEAAFYAKHRHQAQQPALL